ncbi:cell envelope integrity protein TolA [uncultured Enterovirga sp.]|uniref:cell envelope integrity protein TolA n=1 Tax=uncultured Enterovirga sp. TaxID=2026352 RepID=UPI0035CB1820
MALSFDRSEPGFWLSGLAHVGLLAAGLSAFTATKLPDAQEGIPVEVITDNQFSEITRGEITAAKVQPTPAPRAERVADAHVQRAPGEAKDDVPSPPKRPAEVKIADEEVEPAPAPPKQAEAAKPEPAPPPPPARPDRQEVAKAEAAAKVEAAAKAEAAAAKAEAARAEALKLAQREEAEEKAAAAAEKEAADQARAEARAKAKADADAKAELDRKIKEADAKAKADAKAEADAKAKREAERKKVAELKAAKAKAEAESKARRQAEAADKFDPGDISRLLASKEAARSSGSTGREVQKTASLGTETGNAPKLNPSQRDQIAGLIREQLIKCWQPPIAVQSAQKPPTAVIRLGLKQDGSLSTEPSLMNSSSDPLFRPVADSALRATRRCAPLRIPAQFAPFYQDWKDLVVDFDPREVG